MPVWVVEVLVLVVCCCAYTTVANGRAEAKQRARMRCFMVPPGAGKFARGAGRFSSMVGCRWSCREGAGGQNSPELLFPLKFFSLQPSGNGASYWHPPFLTSAW